MSRTTYALLAIAPEISALVIIVWYGLREWRKLQFERKLRTAWLKRSSPEEQRLAAFIKARMNGKTYVIERDQYGHLITCRICGMTSYNRNDIEQKYCGNCHQFHEP